ncbi:MAG: recombination regulator RecX [Betaproteobacteria bacterium]
MPLRENAADLRKRALRHLARREHSRAELERKLAPFAESAASLESVLSELEERKQLSDARFAEQRAHVLGRKYGAARIRHDLKSKGVAAEVIERLAAPDELERAKAILARKYRTAPLTREERARRARFLQGRGFSGDLIHRLVLRDAED